METQTKLKKNDRDFKNINNGYEDYDHNHYGSGCFFWILGMIIFWIVIFWIIFS